MMPSGSRPGKNLRNLWGDLKITEKTILAISPNLVISSSRRDVRWRTEADGGGNCEAQIGVVR